jgi:hypothetical protein
MSRATAPPKMRSSMVTSGLRRPAGVQLHQAEEAEPKRQIDEIQH